MADVSRSRLRGFILPSPRFRTSTLSAALSSYTQQAPEPGAPEDQSAPASRLVLSSIGSATGQSYDVRIAAGGFPDRTDGKAGFIWRNHTDDDWLGWDPPYIRGWSGIVVRADGGTQEDKHPAALALRVGANAGRFLVATSRKAGSAYRISVYATDSAADASWGAEVQAATDGIAAHNWPALIELPTGRVVLYYWVDWPGSLYQIRARYSDDAGATWADYAPWCLPAALDLDGANPEVIAAAYSGGEVALICEADTWLGLTDSAGAQYASSDDGQSFALVLDLATLSPDGFAAGFCVLPIPSGFLFAWTSVATSPIAVGVRAQRIGSAYQPASVDDSVALDPDGALPVVSDSEGGRVAAAVDDDGTLYLISLRTGSWAPGSEAYAVISRSVDVGGTWEYAGARVWESSDFYLDDLSAAFSGGRALLAHGWVSGGYDDASIGAAWLGGYATSTIRPTTASPLDAEWPDRVWVAGESPTALAEWTTATTGAPTETQSEAGLTLAAASGASGRIWSADLSASAEYIRATWRVACASGSSTASRSVFVGLDISDGAASQYSAEVWIGSLGLAVRDVVAGTTIATLTAGMVVGLDLRLELSQGGQLAVLALVDALGDPANAKGAPLRQWATIFAGSITQKTTSLRAQSFIHWGIAASVAASSTWSHAEYRVSEVRHAIPSTPPDLIPRRLAPAPVELTAGYMVAGQLGPAVLGEEWLCPTAYRYAVERLDPREHPSPRAGWRSVDDAAEQVIAWAVSGEASVDGLALTSFLGVYLDGLNWRTGRIEGRFGGAWETLIEIDTAVGQAGLPFERMGNAVRVDPGGSGAASRVWKIGEQVGATVDLGSGAIYRCADSSAGWWAPTGAGLRPMLRLAASAGADPSSGSMDIWARRWVGVIPAALEYEAYRLVIDAQDTVDGDLRVGVAAIGPVVVLPEYGWGRAIETAPNVDVNERIDGSRSAVRRGPPRRRLTVTWGDARPLHQVLGSEIDAFPDYLSADSLAVGMEQDLLSVEGLILQADGPLLPVVYLPTIPRTGAEAWTARDLSIYGRITEPVQLEGAGGDEDVDEVVRVLQVVLEEEV